MQKISLQKRSFFNSIGLDLNNLPLELQTKSCSIQTNIPREDLKFLSQRDLVIPKEKYFRAKNLLGTDKIKLDNKTWLELFNENDKADDVISLYFKNPNYYYKDLKKLGISESGANSIELYEDNGKLFIKEGLARLSLIMIKYLLEMSRAQTKEEKLIINKQYTYSAVVRSVPNDRDVVHIINMLTEIYEQKLKFQKVDDDNEYSYIIKYEDKKMEVNNKESLEDFLKNSYLPRTLPDTELLKKRLDSISKVGLSYKESEDFVEAFMVMGRLFPNYQMFVKYYKQLCELNMQNKLIEKIDLENISYDAILKNLIKIVNQEKSNMSKMENKEKGTKDEKITKVLINEKEDSELIDKQAKSRKNEKITKTVGRKKSKKEEAIQEDIEEAQDIKQRELQDLREEINSIVVDVIDKVEKIYYKVKVEESKFYELAKNTNIEMNIDKIDDKAVSSKVSSIKESAKELKSNLDEEEDFDCMNTKKEALLDLKKSMASQKILSEYQDEMESIYTVCFNKNVQKMITDSKLKKLEQQRREIENEKCSFFSKLIGKAKLKQAKLDNINLKEQLILTETQFSSNSYTTIEDGLSDIYAYVKTEDDAGCLMEINAYVRILETNAQINEMTDQNKLSKKTKEKIEQQRNLPQLVLSKEKRKLFSKAQINLVQEKNNELKRVIQINRANSLKLQNTGMIPIIGNIKSTKAVKNFIELLDKIEVLFNK